MHLVGHFYKNCIMMHETMNVKSMCKRYKSLTN